MDGNGTHVAILRGSGDRFLEPTTRSSLWTVSEGVPLCLSFSVIHASCTKPLGWQRYVRDPERSVARVGCAWSASCAATSCCARRRFNQLTASRMAASVTARVNMDGTNEAQPVAPPNATLQITLSNVPAFSTTRPHSQLRFQNAVASATKNVTTRSTKATRATTLPSSKNWRSHAKYPSTRALGFSGAGNQNRLVGKSSRVTTMPVAEPAGYGIDAVFESQEILARLEGAWWFFALFVIQAALNTILGEELLFRGVLLPKMEGVLGRWSWVANGVLFGLYHVHQPWGIPKSILTGFLCTFPAYRYRSTWMSIILHSAQSVIFAFLVLGVVLGLA